MQSGLCQTCSETTLLVFPRGGSLMAVYTACSWVAFLDIFRGKIEMSAQNIMKRQVTNDFCIIYFIMSSATTCIQGGDMNYSRLSHHLSHIRRKLTFCLCAMRKRRCRSAVISTFVFAPWIVQSVLFLCPKFQVPSHFL